MKVSVIIPVYNAAAYVQQAVESALAQPETAEIILIEDGSTDNSLDVCRELESRYSIVRLLRHPDGKNHGAAISRNTGLANSLEEYIAFLDADDFYLPDRFSLDADLFDADPTIDGVYGALGEFIESEAARERWGSANRPIGKFTTMKRRFSPEQLYEALVGGGKGYIHLNCITVKRSVFQLTGSFNQKTAPHEDTDMLWKIVAKARLLPGKIAEPVALRRIHQNNTISSPKPTLDVYRAWTMLMKEALCWGKNNLPTEKLQILQKRYATEKRSRLWKMFIHDPLDNLFKSWRNR
jgi:glycosyltransferase involved in cell wall biosynthesis